MQRNGKAGIPDFGKKPKGFQQKGANPAAAANVQKQAPPVTPKVQVKPMATSSKSGQRGT